MVRTVDRTMIFLVGGAWMMMTVVKVGAFVVVGGGLTSFSTATTTGSGGVLSSTSSSSKTSRTQLSMARRRNKSQKGRSSHKSKGSIQELTVERDLFADKSSRNKAKDTTKSTIKYVIGSDESGRGAIAGPVVTASCCCIPLKEYCDSSSSSSSTPLSQFFHPIPEVNDSKQVDDDMRRKIFDQVVARSNNNDNTSRSSSDKEDDDEVWYQFHISERDAEYVDQVNILKATMDCFAESIEAVIEKLTQLEEDGDGNDDDKRDDNSTGMMIYSIVDGAKAPKLAPKYHGKVPNRPMPQADAQVYTVAVASILAKVYRDQLAVLEWHKQYPEYGFDEHKGYATPQHIEAIHKYGPCPLHRKSFRSLKGR